MNQEDQDKLELEFRRNLSKEISSYREHLEKQLIHLKWSIGVIGIVAASVFFFLFGKTTSEVNDMAKAQVNERVIDYKVKEEVRERLNQIIEDEITAKETKESAQKLIQSLMSETLGSEGQKELDIAISKKIQEIENFAAKQLIERIPLGSIVASTLPPNSFSGSFGNSDSSVVTWVLADGRNVKSSEYAKISKKEKVPDLRGVFLRGLNHGRNDGKQDPEGENRLAGDFQSDQFKSHSHSFDDIIRKAGIGFARGTASHPWEDYEPGADSLKIKATGGKETRPKNISVYYYIRIN